MQVLKGLFQKNKQKIFSQPIKGTAARSDDKNLDLIQKKNLYNNAKERSENVMVVDLVRNDLSKICEQGSITTDELFGIYSFPQVHQNDLYNKRNTKGRSYIFRNNKSNFSHGFNDGCTKASCNAIN